MDGVPQHGYTAYFKVVFNKASRTTVSCGLVMFIVEIM